MKKYHPISFECEPSVIGVTNGVFQCEILPNKFDSRKDFDKLEDFYEGYEFDAIQPRTVEENLRLEYCELLKKAKITDFIQFSPYLMGCHFILSQRAYEIFSGYNLGSTAKYFKTALKNKSGETTEGDYFMLFQDLQLNSAIDFEQSVFYTGHAVSKNKEYIPINNSIDYQKVLFLNTEHLALSGSFDLNIDFFKARTSPYFYVSEEMLRDFEANSLTGIRRIEQENKSR